MKWITLLLIAAFIAPGCDFKQREKAIKMKEEALQMKEQELNEREHTIQMAEADLAKKQQPDTTKRDSSFLYTQAIVGTWQVRMVCMQTTCDGSAIGDTKIEAWTFSYENNQVVARAMANDKLVRIYTGKVLNDGLELIENIESSPSEPATKIVVRVKKTNEKTMEGQREIVRVGCRILYALQLNK